jgi:hypothetical protein
MPTEIATKIGEIAFNTTVIANCMIILTSIYLLAVMIFIAVIIGRGSR